MRPVERLNARRYKKLLGECNFLSLGPTHFPCLLSSDSREQGSVLDTHVRVELVAIVVASLPLQVVLGVVVQLAIVICNRAEVRVKIDEMAVRLESLNIRGANLYNSHCRGGRSRSSGRSAPREFPFPAFLRYLEFDDFETRGKMDRRWPDSDGVSAGAIARTAPTRGRAAIHGLPYYPRIKTQIKRGRPKLN